MSDWLDSFELMGSSLNEGEKSLMRFAMRKERERIIKLLEDDERKFRAIAFGTAMDSYYSKWDAAVFEIQADYADDLQHRLKFGELDWADEADEADEEEDD